MALSSGLRAARRRSRRNMPDEWAIYRVTREWDEATETNAEVTETIYIGPGALATYEPQESVVESAGASITQQRYTLKVPVETGITDAIRVGDVAVALKAGYNPELGGREYRVRGRHLVSRGGSERLQVTEEVSR